MPTGNSATERPDCKCHGVPMLKTGFGPNGRRRWRCEVIYNARRRELYATDPDRRERLRLMRQRRYEGLSGLEYNRMLLRHRRTKALKRIAKREAMTYRAL